MSGKIAIAFCPGKKDRHAMTGAWHRDLATNLDAIAAWGAVAVITLIDSGFPSGEAVLQVGALRPGAIETSAQETHVMACRPLPGETRSL